MNRDATYEMLLHHSAPFECIPVLHGWNDLPSKFAVPPERDGRPSAVPNGREAADFTVRRRLGQHLRVQNRSKPHLLNPRQSLEITSCQIAGWLSTENALSIAFDSRDGRNPEKRLGRYWVV